MFTDELANGILSYLNIFQRNNSSRFLVGGVFKVIQTVVVQDEPASLPRFVAATCRADKVIEVKLPSAQNQEGKEDEQDEIRAKTKYSSQKKKKTKNKQNKKTRNGTCRLRTLFPKPPFAVWVEECVHEVVAVVLGYFKRLGLNAIVEALYNFKGRSSEIFSFSLNQGLPLLFLLILLTYFFPEVNK